MAPTTHHLGAEELLAHAVGLRRLAVQLVGDGAADDLVQDTLLAGIRRPPRDENALRPWLQRVMHNLARLRWRSEDRRAQREVAAARVEALPSARELVERMDLQRVVAEEVLNLAEPYRSAVLAFYFDGVRAEEHARQRGIPSSTVRSHLRRGIDMLRERLDARVDERSRGDRSAWGAALLGLTRRAPSEARPGPIVTTILASKFLLGLSAALVVTLGLVGWWLVGSSSRAPVSLLGTTTVSLSPSSSELASGSAAMNAVALGGAAQDEAARVALASVVANHGTVTGTVTAGAKGPRVSGIGVGLIRDGSDARQNPPPLAESDANGEFRFQGVVPGLYGLQLDRCNPRITVVVEAGKTSSAALVVSGIEFVRGHVFDDADRPVAGAEIWVYEPSISFGRAIALTDDHGAFVVNWIGPQCGMNAQRVGYVPSGITRNVGDPSIASHDFYLQRGGGSVRGRVVDHEGAPVGGATIWCSMPHGSGTNRSGQSTSTPAAERRVTNADGSFVFESRPSGANVVHVPVDGFAPQLVQVGVVQGQAVDVLINLAQPTYVNGTVRDSNGRPLAKVYITCFSGGGNVHQSVPSADDGTFRISRVAPGRCRLSASSSAHDDTSASIVVTAGDNSWNPVLVACLPLRGRAVDELGQGVSYLGVSAYPAPMRGGTVQTDVNGWFEFSAVRDVPTDLMLIENTLVPPRVWTTLLGVRPSDPNIVLRKGSTSAIRVRGKLVDATGLPVTNAHVFCFQSPGQNTSAITNEYGKFVLTQLVPGHALIRSSKSKYEQGWCGQVLASLELVPGADIALGAITVAGSGSLRIRVRGEGGAPIEWISAFLYNVDAPTGAVSNLHWDGRQAIEVGEVAAGRYRLLVKGPGCGSVHQVIQVESGRENEAEVVLRPGLRVRVLVTWPAGPRASRALTVVVRDEHNEIVDLYRPLNFDPVRDAEYVTTLATGRYTLDAKTSDGLSGKRVLEVDVKKPITDWVELQLQ